MTTAAPSISPTGCLLCQAAAASISGPAATGTQHETSFHPPTSLFDNIGQPTFDLKMPEWAFRMVLRSINEDLWPGASTFNPQQCLRPNRSSTVTTQPPHFCLAVAVKLTNG
ncbi:hypothetical protein FALBO_6411 [Fusarium albosuccineum]|uniref:Uncharacterized protein n=1 Tax=Fusarium albosuccineum TaxID=1237068 RepID=A0A8H4LEJ3_9HYPO|nr:hypothetical protein FALBO_6411 [Fusarium albosuccineum]